MLEMFSMKQAPVDLADGESGLVSPSITSSTSDDNSVELLEQKPPESAEADSSFQQSFVEDNSMEVDGEGVGGKAAKKKVSWAAEDSLVSVHYFEMDESERSEVPYVFSLFLLISKDAPLTHSVYNVAHMI